MIPETKSSIPLVIAYTDGSCLRNPGGRSASAVVLMLPNGRITHHVQGFDASTNQRAELLAAISAMEAVASPEALEAVGTLGRLLIRSDSRYVVDGLRKHLDGGHSLPTANKDLWLRALRAARVLPEVRTEWVKGHNGNPGNELADQLAGNAATHGPWIKDDQSIPEPVEDLFSWIP
jgi:ribonuclease HI